MDNGSSIYTDTNSYINAEKGTNSDITTNTYRDMNIASDTDTSTENIPNAARYSFQILILILVQISTINSNGYSDTDPLSKSKT